MFHIVYTGRLEGKSPAKGWQLCVHDTDIWFADLYLRDEAQSISVPVAYLLTGGYSLPAPRTKNLAFNTKQLFYYITKNIIIPATSNNNFSTKQYIMDEN